MKGIVGRCALGIPSLALLLALGACGDRVDTSAQEDHPSVEINRQGEPGAQSAMAPAAADTAGPATAAMGAAAAPATGTGAIMDPDTRVAMEVKDAIMTDADLSSMKIDVSSQDGAVTLRGRAPDPAARDRATDLARSVREVKSVENLLTLG
jgi:hypothetical protein